MWICTNFKFKEFLFEGCITKNNINHIMNLPNNLIFRLKWFFDRKKMNSLQLVAKKRKVFYFIHFA